ncbi:MAG TPA: hypothetical protein VM243_11590, partial [Phycisphaerae bacterium]|nr:hypothetical protein [Phycisphaerae bacterium]
MAKRKTMAELEAERDNLLAERGAYGPGGQDAPRLRARLSPIPTSLPPAPLRTGPPSPERAAELAKLSAPLGTTVFTDRVGGGGTEETRVNPRNTVENMARFNEFQGQLRGRVAPDKPAPTMEEIQKRVDTRSIEIQTRGETFKSPYIPGISQGPGKADSTKQGIPDLRDTQAYQDFMGRVNRGRTMPGAGGGTMQVAPDARLAEGFGAGNTVPASGYMRVGSDKVVQDVANATGEYQTRPGRGGSILEHVRPEATEVDAGKGAFVPDRARTEYNRISDSLRTEADTGARLNMPTGQFDKLDLGDPKRLLATIQARKEAVGRLSSEDRDVVALLEEGKASKALSERYATPHPLSPAAGKKPAEKPATGTGRRDAVGGLLRAAKSMKSSTARTADGAHKMVRQFYQLSASERQAAIAKDGPLADFDALIQRGIGIEESTRTAFNIPEQTDKPLTTKSEALSEVEDTVWGRLKDKDSPATTKNMAVGGWNKSGGGENNATTQKDMQRTVDDVLERLGKYGHDPKNILRMLDATFTTPKYREREAEAVLTRSVW